MAETFRLTHFEVRHWSSSTCNKCQIFFHLYRKFSCTDAFTLDWKFVIHERTDILFQIGWCRFLLCFLYDFLVAHNGQIKCVELNNENKSISRIMENTWVLPNTNTDVTRMAKKVELHKTLKVWSMQKREPKGHDISNKWQVYSNEIVFHLLALKLFWHSRRWKKIAYANYTFFTHQSIQQNKENESFFVLGPPNFTLYSEFSSTITYFFVS